VIDKLDNEELKVSEYLTNSQTNTSEETEGTIRSPYQKE